MRRLSLVLIGLVFLGLTACRSKPDDKIIVADIQNKMAGDPVTQDSHVAVSSQNGQVTLKGATKTLAAKRKIVSMAKAEPGVSDVEDDTSVGQNGDTQAQGGSVVPPVAAPRTPPPPPPPVVVPAGTVLNVRVNQAISTKNVKTGATFTGTLMTPVTLAGKMVVPADANVTGIVTDAKKAGKFKGGASLTLTLDSITVRGHKYNIVTEYFANETKGKGKRTAGIVGGGAGVGAAIGGIAGGGKGAAIGALAGAAAGTAGAMTGNRDIEFPAESALSFKLDQSLTLKPDSPQGE